MITPESIASCRLVNLTDVGSEVLVLPADPSAELREAFEACFKAFIDEMVTKYPNEYSKDHSRAVHWRERADRLLVVETSHDRIRVVGSAEVGGTYKHSQSDIERAPALSYLWLIEDRRSLGIGNGLLKWLCDEYEPLYYALPLSDEGRRLLANVDADFEERLV